MAKITLVYNGPYSDEIKMTKKGKYIILQKIEDNHKEFRYDLSNSYYEFERIMHYKTKEDVIDTIDMDTEAQKVTSWFTHCNLVTDDEKFAKMFIAAACVNARYKSPVRYIANFGDYKIKDLEKWLSNGIDFKNINEALTRIQQGSSIENIKRTLNIYVSYEPQDFEKEQIKYLRELSQKSNGIDRDILWRVRHNWNPQQYQIGKKLDKIIENERYNDAFTVTEFGWRGDKTTYNYLTHSRYGRDGRTNILEVMSKWQLNPKAFCNYLLKLQYEAVGVDDLMRNYDDYLKREFEMKGRRRAKMNKYPLCWMSYYHKHHFNYQQMKSLKQLMEREGKMEEYNKFKESKKYLEYKKDAYFIRLPESIEDIADEATQLSHCLYERYTDKILDGETIILFMRQVDHPDQSVITVEVKYNGIEQARGHGNRDPTPEEEEWLLNWAGKKGLTKVIRQNY